MLYNIVKLICEVIMKILYKLLILILSAIIVLSATSCHDDGHTNQPESHKCESRCETCGGCTDKDCAEDICKDKCNGGHINLPDINVGDLK